MPDSPSESPIATTPMLSQYRQIKAQYPDAILFYRMGDFYEMFFEDAIRAAPLLEVQLTSRDKNSASPVPMCGIPYHAAANYLQKLVSKGCKVAICEQMEEPTPGKGIVRREVVRVVTPSLVGDPDLVPEEATNILVALHAETENKLSVATLDLLGGQIRSGSLDSQRALIDLFLELRPKEVLVSRGLADQKKISDLLKLFPGITLTFRDQYFESCNEPLPVAAIRAYLKETQKQENASYFLEASCLLGRDSLRLDPTTVDSLEIVPRAQSQDPSHTLYGVLDSALTPMGRRMLKVWLMHPSAELEVVEERLEATEVLVKDATGAGALRHQLTQIRDLERLTTKTALGLSMPRDLVAIGEVLARLPELADSLAQSPAGLLRRFSAQVNPLTDLANELKAALLEEPAATLREGNIFRDSYHSEIAGYRRISHDAKGSIASIETRERLRTRIASLKIRFSKVFGYTIEITKSHLGKVPPEYQRKQTLANGERFVTAELKDFEEAVLAADHRLKALEESLFLELRRKVATQAAELLKNARWLATLDVLLSFAKVAAERNYVRPRMVTGWELEIVEGRHPVIESLLPLGTFVPNSVRFEAEECRTLIITGPNMAGKSTVMRQVALISIMAQAGSFVPAASARLSLVDAIYTRIGSSDDLTRGRSTFMVEMTEVARILERATERSLLVVDEIGRGTSTYDGLSLAWSLLEFFHTELRAKLLFATHFHELTALENSLSGVRNANVLVEKWRDDIVFLHKLVPGVCHQSYGIEVASLAGLPPKVLLRAKELLDVLESQSRRADRVRNRALDIHHKQLGLFEEFRHVETQAGREI